MALTLNNPSGGISGYTTSADGSTRVIAAQTASTVALSTAQGTVFNSLGTTSLGQNPIAGFASTAAAVSMIQRVNQLCDDMQNTKELLNSLVSDLGG